MKSTKAHWTESSLSDYLFRIGADFVLQLEEKIGAQKDLAKVLKVTEGAVSQKLNNPGNLKLHTMIKYARALGLKLSIVLYDDGDSRNERGPIHADIFRICWENSGKPADFWNINEDNYTRSATAEGTMPITPIKISQSRWNTPFFHENQIAHVGGGNG